jgi:hypothetical protein
MEEVIMNRLLGSSVAVGLLSCSVLLTGCISHTTVYEDEEPTVVKMPKPTPAPTKKTAKKSGSSTKDPVVVVHQHQFHYYPSCQVYRDCESKRWFWCEAGVWKISATLPKTIVIADEKPCLIVIENDHPKHHHAEHAVLNEPKKSLPTQANGLAKGHDKQNAKAEAQTEVVAQASVTGSEDQHDDAGDHEDADHGRGNSGDEGHGKDKDKEKDTVKDEKKDKSDKQDKNAEKGKGKKKD